VAFEQQRIAQITLVRTRRGRIATTGSAEAAGPDAQDATGDGAGEQTRADCEPTARSMPVG